jgi:Cu-processing system permease protein
LVDGCPFLLSFARAKIAAMALLRILTIAENTYREAVRAKILHGLIALAVGTSGYSLVVGAYALRNQSKVVSDLGAASISLYSIVVAIILGATSLYRELELKTLFPILARPIERWEYLVGKYLGTLLVLVAFIGLNSGLLLFAVGAIGTRPLSLSLLLPAVEIGLAVVLGWRVPRARTWLPLPLSLVLLATGAWFASESVTERAVILGQGLFTALEVSIVTCLCLVFAAFSTPFLTGVFTISVFLVGRSADTLARLPEVMFGPTIKQAGMVLSQVVPNLMVYVPTRELLSGEAAGVSLAAYASLAALQSASWSLGLLTLAALVFRRRDFL